MPTYEYECTKCGALTEAFQKMSDDPLKTCETCGGELTRLVSGGTGLIFKGSGFYITDYKGGNAAAAKAEAKAESKGEGKSEGKSESGGDSKSESKPESKPATSSSPETKSSEKS